MEIVVIVLFCLFVYYFSINKAKQANELHNQKEKDNPKFRPATNSDAKTFAWLVFGLFLSMFLGILISVSSHGG